MGALDFGGRFRFGTGVTGGVDWGVVGGVEVDKRIKIDIGGGLNLNLMGPAAIPVPSVNGVSMQCGGISEFTM